VDQIIAPSPPEHLSFSYVPRAGLLKLTIVNLLLNIVTLGFYRFWAKTNVRRHIWSCVHINGEPLEYTGSGKELFMGFLVVVLAIFIPLAAMTGAIILAYGPESPLLTVLNVLVVLFVQVFWGFAIYRARRYQLSRTHWRGIRGTMAGSAMIFSLTYFGSIIAKAMSLGWATPVMNTALQEQMTGDMRFGDAAFKFKGRAGALYPTYALCWFLSLLFLVGIPVLVGSGALGFDMEQIGKVFEQASGTSAPPDAMLMAGLIGIGLFLLFIAYVLIFPLLWAVYTAKELRVFAAYTRFDGAQFKMDVGAGSVIGLTIVNILIIVFTLGVAWPYVQQRLVRFLVDRISLDGAIDIDRIQQSQAPLDLRGEGLADAFDVGGI
jgi:uncharacterized membrane protein YjgN (DUF898 family)